ncbi:ABC transporter substrate-binding protein [Acetanaerobacterium elongatum]|uniref:ABC-type glycerol-3-phosphate transport system, substrate-binding protein n=1 Tax=Acetanaerobacterium elongatum TaxID=258515 RepID=A0A1G9WBR7_9FIRM|nr:ABC transporter substrate-binding protein [Acetanaerobacterium elongatum]SDM81661.1 ABC-type glycerol-3-phosphate transport system, substrate-binding protein [Acetanaerobacterium elongatum]
MSSRKRILAALLGAAIISTSFTACNSGTANTDSTISKEQTPKGGYVETEITPPNVTGNPLGLWVNTDGSIDYWAENASSPTGNGLYHSTDNGATWQQVDLNWVNDLKAGLLKLAVTGSGNYFAVTQGSSLFEVWKVNKGEKPVKIPVSGLEDAAKGGRILTPIKLQAIGEDSFLLEYMTMSAEPQPGGSDTGVTVKSPGAESKNSSSNSALEPGSSSSEETRKSGTAYFSYSAKDGSVSSDQFKQVMGIYNVKGELVKVMDNLPDIRACATNEQALFMMDYSGKIQASEISTGNLLSQYASNAEIKDMNTAFTVDKDGNAYLASNSGIQRIASGGSLAETVLEGSMYSIGTPTASVKHICNAKDGSFLLACESSNNTGKLYRYVYDETISVSPDNTLTVWSLKESPTVRAAIPVFQKKNKNFRVNYEVALTKEATAAGTQDVLRSLVTELLAGKGPDVLILDGLDYQSYKQQGLLGDISKQMDVSGLYQSVIKPFQGSDGLYVLPTRFSLPLLFGKKSGLDTLNSLKDLVAAIEKAPQPKQVAMNSQDYNKAFPEAERSAFSFEDLRDAFDFFYNVSEPTIINDGKGIQTDALRQLLDAVKTVSDKYELVKPNTQTEEVKIGVAASNSNGFVVIKKSLMDYSMEHTLYGSNNFTALDVMRFIISSGSIGEPDVKLMPGLCQGVYYPSAMAGVNAKSSKQKEALAFIASMLSDEVQSFTLGDGLPVTQSGMKLIIDTYNKENEKNAFYGGATTKIPPLKMDINSLISQVSTPVTIDTAMADIIFKSAERYCKGEISIEDAIKAISSETEIILAEKK